MAPIRQSAKAVTAALEALKASDSSLAQLDAARQAREAAERLEVDCVRAARADSQSWSKIGALYGLSKQGVQQRFRRHGTHTDRPSR